MMATMKKHLHQFNTRFDSALAQFTQIHRFLGFLIIFVGMPLATVAAVFISAASIILPFAWFFGLL